AELVDRPAPELTVTAACCAGFGAPEGSWEVAFIRARITQIVDIPHALHSGRVAWIRVRAWIVRFEGSTTDARNPGLARGVENVDDGGSIAPDALESAGVAGGTEHALSLKGHLFEYQVLGLDVGSAHVILAFVPARADDIGPVVIGDPRVLIQLGLPGEIVWSVVDEDIPGVRCDCE